MIQEVYDVFYGNPKIRSVFLEYKDTEYAVRAEDETDLQQLYIKGIVDGMRIFYTLMCTFGESNGWEADK